MALDLPLPSNILTHAHWTLGKEKMAKSTGNVVNPFFALDRFGVDVMRFYLAHDGGIAQDADYTNDYILERHRVILQGQLGNLASRLIRGKGWDLKSVVENMRQREPQDLREMRGPRDVSGHAQWQGLNSVAIDAGAHMETYQVGLALKRIVRLLSQVSLSLSPITKHGLLTTISPDECLYHRAGTMATSQATQLSTITSNIRKTGRSPLSVHRGIAYCWDIVAAIYAYQGRVAVRHAGCR